MRGNLEQVVTLAMRQVRAPEFQKIHAATARQGLAQHLAQRNDRPRTLRIVDGRRGAAEESVKLYGIIRYEFDSLIQAALWAKAQLEALSPVLTGRYRGSWFLMVNGQAVEPVNIPADVRGIIIANDQPYSRKLVAGKRGDGRPFSLQNLPPGFLAITEYAVRDRYRGALLVRSTFVDLDGGYRLRNAYREFNNRRVRPENRAGRAITYPALFLGLT
jgi:hypothetical protein